MRQQFPLSSMRFDPVRTWNIYRWRAAQRIDSIRRWLKDRFGSRAVKVHVVPARAAVHHKPVETTAKLNTPDFAMIVKLKFHEKIEEMRKEFGADVFDKYCAVIFGCRYANGAGICDGIDGRTDALLLLMATCVHRIADNEMAAQRFLPKQDSYHVIMAKVCAKLMAVCHGMTMDTNPGGTTPPPPPASKSGIILT